MLQCPEKSPSFAVLLKKTRAGSSWWCFVGRCSGCGEWRRDVCQVSWEEIHDGENETVVENVEEFVVEVVDVVGLRNDGWWIVRAWDLGGLLVEYTGLESFPPLLGYWIPLWTSSEVCHQD